MHIWLTFMLSQKMEIYRRIPICCFVLLILLLGIKEAYSAECTCGKPILQRVVGGREAKVEDYPWLLAMQKFSNKQWSYQCVASLIHPQWALTASHCFQRNLTGGFASKGECFDAHYKKISCFLEPLEIQLALASSQGTKREFTVSQVIVHPEYVRDQFAGDIGLMQLSQPAVCGRSVALICVSEGEHMDYPNKPVTLAGWGQTAGNLPGKADRLRETDLDVMAKDRCPAGQSIPGILCTLGQDFGGTPCKGDSGGPLMYEDNQLYYVTGVVSHGTPTCHLTGHVMFTLVTPYLDWIRQYVNLNEVQKAVGASEAASGGPSASSSSYSSSPAKGVKKG